MQVSVKTTSGLEREVTVALPADSFEAKVDERIKAAAGDVRLPGFRPGKVPLKEVRRRFGIELRQQVAAEVLQSSFEDVVRQEQLALAGQATLHLGNIEPGDDFQYTATFEVMPTVELADLTKLRVGRPEAEINEADIDETVEQLRSQSKKWQAVERPAREGDSVIVDYSVTVAGRVVREPTQTRFVVGDEDNTGELNGALLGVAANDKRVFPTKVRRTRIEDAGANETTAQADDDGAEDDGLGEASPEANLEESADAKQEDAAPQAQEAVANAAVDEDATPSSPQQGQPLDEEVPGVAEIVVHSVEEGVLPELDDEFFDSFGVDKVDAADEGEDKRDRPARFRELVRERMQVELDTATRHTMRQQVYDVLADAHEFEVPRAMLEAEVDRRVRSMQRLLDVDVPEKLVEALRPAAEKEVRAGLVLREVVRQAGIEPDDQLVRNRIEEIASAYEEAADVRRLLYSDEERLQHIENAVAEQQAVEHVLSQTDAIPVAMSYRDVVGGQVPELPEPELADVDEEEAPVAQPVGDAQGEPDGTPDDRRATGIGQRLWRFLGAGGAGKDGPAQPPPKGESR